MPVSDKWGICSKILLMAKKKKERAWTIIVIYSHLVTK